MFGSALQPSESALAREETSERDTGQSLQKAKGWDLNGRVKLSLEISRKLSDVLDNLAANIQGTKSDVLRRGVALFRIAVEAEEKGLNLAVVDAEGSMRERIVLG